MAGRASGILVRWNDDRGYGFIAPQSGGPQLFAHVSAFPRSGRPAAGDAVTFLAERAPDGRRRAVEIAWTNRRTAPSSTVGAVVVTLGMSGVLVAAVGVGLPLWIPAIYVVASLLTAAVYAQDKRAAAAGRWRVSEATLLMLGLVGGWPGALVAQQVLRHKTRKASFRFLFWVTVVLNVTALAAVLLYVGR